MPDDDSPPAPPVPRVHIAELLRGPFDIKSMAITGLLILATLYSLYFARTILMPVVLALLLSYLLVPPVRLLRRARIPPVVGAAIVLGSLGAIVVTLAVQLAPPAAGWMEKAPYSLHRLQQMLHPLKAPIEKVTEASAEIEKITEPQPKGKAPTVVQVKRSRMSELLFNQTPDFVAAMIAMVILLYFLLASDGLFLRKLIKVIPRLADKKRAVEIAREVELCISRYLVAVTLINTGLGITVAITMSLLGMPNPVLWGVLVGCLHFVPYLGAVVCLIAITLAAVLSFDSLAWALAVPSAYLVLATIEGNFVTPMVLGRSLTLNPIVIVLSLMFWGWLWGIAGTLLAVPILATFKILCDHIKPLATVGEFLSD